MCPISNLPTFRNSSQFTPQQKHEASSLPRALRAREGTENSFCVCVHACTYRKTWALLQQRMQQAGYVIQLLPSSSDRALRTQIHRTQGHMRPAILWEVKLITLSGPLLLFFPLSFSILHIHSTGFFSHRLINDIACKKKICQMA